MLTRWLDYHRQTLRWKCQGLSADQLKTAAAEPSNLTLLGQVRHMAEVERGWFRRRICGRWVYVHMIEEYARHNGHADLLRERIDGVTGG